MIELRWVERVSAPEHDGATGYTYKVLQYRRKDRHLDVAFIDDEIYWSSWQDVPTVREDKP